MLKTYLKKLLDITSMRDAREESYYTALEWLLSGYADSSIDKDIHITILPKKTEAGNPDFRIWDGKQHIVGYIEAKQPTTENLDNIEHSEQLKRYRHTFPNLVLTNFFEFRLYRDGNLIDSVSIARPFIMHELGKVPPVEKKKEFFKLLEKFFSFSLPKVYNAEKLAIELAKRTRFLRDEVIAEELREEEDSGSGHILGFYDAFKKYLISDLNKKDFADLYSQTITYGLFAARTRTEDGFNRKLAYDNIPHTIGILRDVFEFISLGEVPLQMEWMIDDISEVLAVTDVKNILHKFFHEGKGKDPIVHFYETFLAEYDPETREKRGVYYTPEPVVSYIVRSTNHILKKHFNKSEGFASEGVTILDPAAGTLTFIAEAVKLAVKEFVEKYGEGGKEGFIKDHILENFYAFELMMAPYAVGHLKMSLLLEELGYKIKNDDRFKLYLTNTLEMEELPETRLPGTASLSEESHKAGKIKKEQPILVILGNPPYSVSSANKGEWIEKLLMRGYAKSDGTKDDGYYKIQGKSIKEKKVCLKDDYVKFIRFAQWKIDQAGEGILGFITNHGYLDNPTFRGMRESLTKSFNEMYLLDLHGNALKKEKCPNGSKDENIFDIRQGVAIILFIKMRENGSKCKIFHYDLWGLRERKYEWLLANDIKSIRYKEISPQLEFYLFIPVETKGLKWYKKFLKIPDIFPANISGVETAKDRLTIQFTYEKLWRIVLNFSKLEPKIARKAYNLGKDGSGWKVRSAQQDLLDTGLYKERIVPILYRPFDIRYTYYTEQSGGFLWRPRSEIMRNMLKENLGLISVRQVAEGVFNHAFVSNSIVDRRVTLSSKGAAFLYPLYTYKINLKEKLFTDKSIKEKEHNINSELFNLLYKLYIEPEPEEIFYYIYATLYSNIYREKYAELLKIDFPRIPFTKDYELFKEMGKLGKRLVELHLLESDELSSPIARFQGEGDNRIAKSKRVGRDYNPEEKRVYINKDKQYFEGIGPEVWEYMIGGYQVLDKWLYYRSERKLLTDEIKHFCKMVTALKKTIEIQKEIDKKYPKIEKNIIDFKN